MGDPLLSIPETFNVAEYFVDRNVNEGRGEHTAILFQEQKISYREVADQVQRAANLLLAGGLVRGDRLILILYDSPEFVATFWGAIRAGVIPIPTNTLLTAEEYAFMLHDSGARGLVVESSLFQKIEPALNQLPEMKTVWISGQPHTGGKNFEDDMALAPTLAVMAATHRDDPAFWLYTSGSTGKPKAAIHRHRDMVYCLESYAKQVLGIGPPDITFSTSKLFFAYGLGNALYFPFGVGATTVLLPERPSPEKIFETLLRFRPTLFFAVPAVYAAMLQAPGVDTSVMRSVRRAVSAGEALPAPLWARFKDKFGPSILDGIGSTEMLHMFISNRPDDTVPGCSGKLVPGNDARIVNEFGHTAPTGEIGELHIRGKSAAAGYWNRPELTQTTFPGEWTLTGDKYYCDDRGYYWYCGRTDDMMKVSSQWVSPLEVETELLSHPLVYECAVVGAMDADGLTKPKAFVVLKPTETPPREIEAELRTFLKARLPGYKVPQWIVLAKSLPRTVTGKIQRFKLRSPTQGAGK
ncbi:MAG TPA: benzoate-CoA ligase family protein [Terriglobia bacterium]|nr:benzoate-CoA ligase family protein [Terriglobia bacterium]